MSCVLEGSFSVCEHTHRVPGLANAYRHYHKTSEKLHGKENDQTLQKLPFPVLKFN